MDDATQGRLSDEERKRLRGAMVRAQLSPKEMNVLMRQIATKKTDQPLELDLLLDGIRQITKQRKSGD